MPSALISTQGSPRVGGAPLGGGGAGGEATPPATKSHDATERDRHQAVAAEERRATECGNSVKQLQHVRHDDGHEDEPEDREPERPRGPLHDVLDAVELALRLLVAARELEAAHLALLDVDLLAVDAVAPEEALAQRRAEHLAAVERAHGKRVERREGHVDPHRPVEDAREREEDGD